eukprot:13187194-Ditylum_brightwellii.AAC.1
MVGVGGMFCLVVVSVGGFKAAMMLAICDAGVVLSVSRDKMVLLRFPLLCVLLVRVMVCLFGVGVVLVVGGWAMEDVLDVTM